MFFPGNVSYFLSYTVITSSNQIGKKKLKRKKLAKTRISVDKIRKVKELIL